MTTFRFAISLCVVNAALLAQTQTVPFNVLGHIQTFTADTDCATNVLCGAKIKVNGITITIPQNSILFFPARLLVPGDVFRFKADIAGRTGAHPRAVPADPLQVASGLALDDPANFTPLAAFEADVVGNIVNRQYIAGLVHISQQSLNVSDGYVLAINPALGEMTVGPEDATPGDPAAVRVRINDPILPSGNGRYSKGGSMDERFTADQDNSTVRSSTGFPMCIPGGTAGSCPAINRPTCTATVASDPQCPNGTVGGPAVPRQRLTMGATDMMAELNGPGVFPAPACPTCDPTKQAPFVVGDRITFSGTLAQDATGKYISAHTITAWVAIFSKNPAYLSIETSLIGTGGIPFSGVDQETGPGKVVPGATGTTRIKIEVLTTDPSRAVEVYAIDYTNSAAEPIQRSLAVPGNAKLRPRGGTTGTPPIPKMTMAPSAKPPFGRVRLVVDRANYLPPPRELGVRFVGLAMGSQANANGVWSGQYEAPVGEFIFPEALVFGQRPVPANFENFCFLQGSGPLRSLGRAAATPLVGRLNPWPESGHPAPQASCP